MDGEIIVVDGSNVAWESLSTDGKPEARNIVAVRQALVAAGFEPEILVDAALRHQVDDPQLMERLIREQTVRQVPANTDGDLWVLKAAEAQGAYFLSNDLYKEYWERYAWLDERRVRFMLIGGRVLLHGRTLSEHAVLEPQVGQPPLADPNPDAEVNSVLREQLWRENAVLRSQRDLHAREYERLQAENARLRAEMGRAIALEVENHRLHREIAAQADLVEQARREMDDAGRRDARNQAILDTLAHEREQLESATQQLRTLTEELAALRRADAEHQKQRDTARERADKLAQQVELLGKRSPRREVEPHPEVLRLLNEIMRTVGDADARSRSMLAEGSPTNATDVPAVAQPPNGVAAEPSDDRIERAWLAGSQEGDEHSRMYFLEAAEGLRRANPELRDDERLLHQIDALRQKVGDFDYCHLSLALQNIKNPNVKNNYFLVRLRGAIREFPCESLIRSGAHLSQS